MDNPENNYVAAFYLVNDKPAHAYRFAVNLFLCRDFLTFTEGKRGFLNTVNCLKYFIRTNIIRFSLWKNFNRNFNYPRSSCCCCSYVYFFNNNKYEF